MKSNRLQETQDEIMVQWQKVVTRIQARNQDLTEEDAIAIADRFTREIIEEMKQAGKVRFQPG